MNAVNTLHISPSQALGKAIVWLLRFVLLLVLYFILFAMSGSLVAPYLPTTPVEPGPVPFGRRMARQTAGPPGSRSGR